MEKKPLVSVSMPNYNQAKYISDAILGVLSQQADFDIELIVSDDCSPDQTESIVQNIIHTHPNGKWIRYVKHDKNKGAIPNFEWTISQAKGRYIAVCEGDDYWTDPLKLQKQIDFLENNPEYSISFHKVKEVSTSGEEQHTILNSPETEQTLTIEDLAKGNCIHTPSVVFRKNMEILPEWLPYSPIGDYPLHMLNAEFGLIKYFPEEMAAYRIGDGMWSSQTRAFQLVNTLFALKLLITHFKQNENVKKILSEQSNFLMDELTQIQKVQIDFAPEKAAYNLSLKKLFVILIRKLRYSLKR